MEVLTNRVEAHTLMNKFNQDLFADIDGMEVFKNQVKIFISITHYLRLLLIQIKRVKPEKI